MSRTGWPPLRLAHTGQHARSARCGDRKPAHRAALRDDCHEALKLEAGHLLQVRAAKASGKPAIYLPQSIGPVRPAWPVGTHLRRLLASFDRYSSVTTVRQRSCRPMRTRVARPISRYPISRAAATRSCSGPHTPATACARSHSCRVVHRREIACSAHVTPHRSRG